MILRSTPRPLPTDNDNNHHHADDRPPLPLPTTTTTTTTHHYRRPRLTRPPRPGWTFCAWENTRCGFTGTLEVSYGANGTSPPREPSPAAWTATTPPSATPPVRSGAKPDLSRQRQPLPRHHHDHDADDQSDPAPRLDFLRLGVHALRIHRHARGQLRSERHLHQPREPSPAASTATTPPSATPAGCAQVVRNTAGVPVVPTNTAAPSITGLARIGQTLTASTGTWQGSPTSFGYKWSRCDLYGANCTPITNATNSTYIPVTADKGKRLIVTVIASNAAGSAFANSPATPMVKP